MNIEKDYIFKICRKSDGLYSTGGTNPQFNKIGKVWKTIGHLKNHLKLVGDDYYKDRAKAQWAAAGYDDCEIEIYKVMTTRMYWPEVTDILKEYKPK